MPKTYDEYMKTTRSPKNATQYAMDHEPDVYPQEVFWLHHRIDHLTKLLQLIVQASGFAFTKEELEDFHDVINFDDGRR